MPDKATPTKRLVDEFCRLKERHDSELVVERTAAVTLGPSLIRAYNKGTKPRLFYALLSVDLESFSKCESREEFRKFFEAELEKVYRALAQDEENIRKHGLGLKWGHATKVLCIFLRDLVVYSRYFDEDTAKRLERFLYNPIDGIVMRKLEELGNDTGARRIKDIDTPDGFWRIQNLLGEAAELADTVQIRFDDVQAERRDE
jgi:hypothetical protein